MGKKRAKKDFEHLSWFDLESWAGSKIVSRGKSYQRGRAVRDLAITDSEELVAWVDGSTTYATKVAFDKGDLSSSCSCPYYGDCKHAVAVILEYLECIENGKEVPMAGKDDERLMLAESELEDPDDDFYDTDYENDDLSERGTRLSAETGADNYLQGKSKEELLALVNGIMARHPEVRDELDFKSHIAQGKPSALVKTVEKEIAKASSEPGWQNHWKHTGYTPDYSRVQGGLQKLFDEGHADEVVRLGEKLFSAGVTQVEQSHDEGETGREISASMEIVFKALPECSLSEIDKMERAVDFGLRDEYSLCDGLESFWTRKFSKKDWSSLADRLLCRLNEMKSLNREDELFRDYRRDRLSDEIIRALHNAGRQEEVIQLCMKEAEITRNYMRLVKQLRKEGRTEEAEVWIRKGIAATKNKWAGIASSLKGELLNIRSIKKDWLFVAALRVDDFCGHPSLMAFGNLRKASEKAKVWPQIREAALNFLETGKLLMKDSQGWPLPDTGFEKPERSRYDKPPYTAVLIEIAIYEKRLADVLKWYDVHNKQLKFGGGEGLQDEVATAIADEYPDKAVAIWKALAESQISITNVAAYGIGASYLRKAQRTLLKQGKRDEWNVYLQNIKQVNRRKPRLMQILDALSEKPIIRGGPKK